MRLVADLPTLSWGETFLRLLVAAALGGLVGLERELEEKAAGLRTHMLVSVGSALFTIVGAYGFQEFFTSGSVSFDPSRVAAQIVTGIGFLGAGVIVRTNSEQTHIYGLTTAACIWLTACIGVVCAVGAWPALLVALVLTFLLLVFGGPVERFLHRRLGAPSD
jgi:putative Mg2+ transporter-C (MgtC) family protein